MQEAARAALPPQRAYSMARSEMLRVCIVQQCKLVSAVTFTSFDHDRTGRTAFFTQVDIAIISGRALIKERASQSDTIFDSLYGDIRPC